MRLLLHGFRPDQRVDHRHVATILPCQERRHTGERATFVRSARCMARDNSKNGAIREVKLPQPVFEISCSIRDTAIRAILQVQQPTVGRGAKRGILDALNPVWVVFPQTVDPRPCGFRFEISRVGTDHVSVSSSLNLDAVCRFLAINVPHLDAVTCDGKHLKAPASVRIQVADDEGVFRQAVSFRRSQRAEARRACSTRWLS